MITFLSLLLFGALIAWAFIATPAHTLARALRSAVPAVLLAVGGVLLMFGRAGIALPLIVIGLSWLARNRSVGHVGGGGGRKSSVRSAWLDMELDHDTGGIDGIVLAGDKEGSTLSGLNDEELMELYAEVGNDADSASLLEAYLDRRMAGWREHADFDPDAGQGGTSSSGPMTKEEAYQILGIAPGAGAREIRDAHRRLMKRLHPDSGGSNFLAAKINQAKDVLLD